jgi:hypothetical protein
MLWGKVGVFKCKVCGDRFTDPRKHYHTVGELRGRGGNKLVDDWRRFNDMRGGGHIPGQLPSDKRLYAHERLMNKEK